MIGNVSTPGGIRPVRFGAGIGAIGGDTYRQAVVNTGPVGYWRMGEASGTNAVDQMGANNGTYVGTPTLGAAGALVGDSNTAVTFDGLSQYVTVPYNAALTTLVNSMAAWVTILGGTGTNRYLLSNRGTFPNSGSIIQVGTNNILTHQFIVAGTWGNVYAPSTVTIGTTYFVVSTFDGTTARLYINGSTVGTPVATAGAQNLGTAFRIGTGDNGGPAYYANATIDEPAIWNRALSAAEIAMLYAIGTATW